MYLDYVAIWGPFHLYFLAYILPAFIWLWYFTDSKCNCTKCILVDIAIWIPYYLDFVSIYLILALIYCIYVMLLTINDDETIIGPTNFTMSNVFGLCSYLESPLARMLFQYISYQLLYGNGKRIKRVSWLAPIPFCNVKCTNLDSLFLD